ncbi:MAG: polysaccharide deacetylase family protein [Candidatus Thiodiazotropha sp. (ex Dulcina madagascariensis)]|nr:polysaccharide deacetylase family protein [Candidatus Thiodiazotropha sp. (ex Dulcina madagascariensis)]
MKIRIALILCLLLGTGCSSRGFYMTEGDAGPSQVIAKDNEFVVLRVGSDDARTLAKRFFGDEARYWVIEDANDSHPVEPGNVIIIPLRDSNPTGFGYEGYQTVPILCYHRFGNRGDRLEVSSEQFREQLNYLKENDYRVIPLADLLGFLKGERALPKRSVVLTIDDGHRSIYREAFPILKEFGYPATVFIYTDYMNNGGLKTDEIAAMTESGLISIQPHSKSHGNLAVRRHGEDHKQYQRRIRREVTFPTKKLAGQLGQKPRFYAYPFGDANDQVIQELQANGLLLGLTVQPHANAAFSYPYLLRRTMIFGDRDMDVFKSSLVTYKSRKK